MISNNRTEFLKKYDYKQILEKTTMKRHNPDLINKQRTEAAKEALKGISEEEKNIGREPGE